MTEMFESNNQTAGAQEKSNDRFLLGKQII